MKKIMRKLFSFFVVFALVLSIMQIPESVSQAADTEITEVNIEVEIPVLDDDATVRYTADYDSYTVTTRTTNWEEANMYEVDIIENTSDYGVVFVV
ncbi:MAG: hypothetical protein IJX12_00230 [Lachnospiraceae bacterium]|nr:hypothetical protein [Lachnospiraceae bacterium]